MRAAPSSCRSALALLPDVLAPFPDAAKASPAPQIDPSLDKAATAQGAKDPLQNAKGRAMEMEKLCPNVEVIMVDGGHCPFDEQPEFCNEKLTAFVGSLTRTPAPPAELSAA